MQQLTIYRQYSTQTKALLWANFWVLVYLLLILLLPTNLATVQQYHLSGSEFRVLSLLAGLPTIIVWVTAFFGYAALASYAEKVNKSGEGKSYVSIARGLKWLAWGLPISTCTDYLLGGITRLNPELQSVALIISHYVYLLISLIAFHFMSNGSRGLRELVERLPSKTAVRIMIAAAIVMSVGYCAITLNAVDKQHPNSYRLPLWLILLTIIVPYLYAWLMGFIAVFEISQYRRTIRGVIYKQALILLASGTTLAIIASIALQYLTSTSRYVRRIMLDGTLLATFLILITFAVGFILIAVGASKLKKIEEV